MAEKTMIENWLNEGDTSGAITEEPKAYKKKAVAWIDILGVREMIKDEKKYSAEDVITMMHTLRSFVNQACGHYEEKREMDFRQIADGIIIAASMDYINELCEAIATIQWRVFTELNKLTRGAITIGNVSIEDEGDIIIGPAYIDVYALESENAYFARTVISNDFVVESKADLQFEFIAEDSDKIKYIDYVGYALQKEGKTSEQMRRTLEENGCIKYVEEGFTNEKVSIKQKYGWTIALLQRHNIHI
jgi:hypothetical protein